MPKESNVNPYHYVIVSQGVPPKVMICQCGYIINTGDVAREMLGHISKSTGKSDIEVMADAEETFGSFDPESGVWRRTEEK